MDVTIVGSGTVAPEGDRVCASYFVVEGALRMLLDCGPGSLHHLARFGLPWGALSHLVLSHFHTDHLGGVPILFFALRYGLPTPRSDTLTVLGPVGTAERFERMADAFGDHLRDPGFPLTIREIAPGEALELPSRVWLRAAKTPHTPESLAYRLDVGHASLGYTGDTGYDEALAAWFEGVDTLVAECSLPDELAMDAHLTPARVAALARRARPRRLVLTHVYPQLDRETLPDRIRDGGWGGETLVAMDGMRLVL